MSDRRDAYHADPNPGASLSASIAHVLTTRSPLHAWTQHPKLNPHYERVEDPKFDLGTVVHALLLEGDRDSVVVCDFPDWRTKAAQEARAVAREHGKIPLLVDQYANVLAMLEAVYEQLLEHEADPPLLPKPGSAEIAVLWQEQGVHCKALLDWLPGDCSVIDDLKTTSRSAEPSSYARALYGTGGDVQAAFYLRAVERVFEGSRPQFRWIVVETTPPYALSVITPAPDVIALGDAKVDRALRLWAELLETPAPWPGYPKSVVRAELPPWEEARFLERTEADL